MQWRNENIGEAAVLTQSKIHQVAHRASSKSILTSSSGSSEEGSWVRRREPIAEKRDGVQRSTLFLRPVQHVEKSRSCSSDGKRSVFLMEHNKDSQW